MQAIEFKKLHPNAVIPTRANIGDAGFDLTAVTARITEEGYIEYGTGLAINLESIKPSSNDRLIWADLRPRSSISKYDLVLANSVGTIDLGYRGEICCRFKPLVRFELSPRNTVPYNLKEIGGYFEHVSYKIVELEKDNNSDSYFKHLKVYKIGDKIAQLIICEGPLCQFKEVEDFTASASNRGTGGFGSTSN